MCSLSSKVGRKPRIGDLEVEDPVDLELRIVLGDANLRWHVERNLAQIVPIGDLVDERNHEAQARLEHFVELAPALDDERALLRHDANPLVDENDRDHEDCERDQH